MSILQRALNPLDGGRVLDVATGEGGFVRFLADMLSSYTEIVGIDADEAALETARASFDQENIRFVPMDAGRMDFPQASFDTVVISASLHHLADAPRVLAEMDRVLKPGGHLVVAEMHRDGQTEPQRTAVCIHHWAAEVDTALGVVHHPTLARQELIELVDALGVQNVKLYDFFDTDSDPQEAVEQVEDYLDRFLQRAEGAPNSAALKQRAEALRQRLHRGGVQREPVVVIVGRKATTEWS